MSWWHRAVARQDASCAPCGSELCGGALSSSVSTASRTAASADVPSGSSSAERRARSRMVPGLPALLAVQLRRARAKDRAKWRVRLLSGCPDERPASSSSPPHALPKRSALILARAQRHVVGGARFARSRCRGNDRRHERRSAGGACEGARAVWPDAAGSCAAFLHAPRLRQQRQRVLRKQHCAGAACLRRLPRAAAGAVHIRRA